MTLKGIKSRYGVEKEYSIDIIVTDSSLQFLDNSERVKSNKEYLEGEILKKKTAETERQLSFLLNLMTTSKEPLVQKDLVSLGGDGLSIGQEKVRHLLAQGVDLKWTTEQKGKNNAIHYHPLVTN